MEQDKIGELREKYAGLAMAALLENPYKIGYGYQNYGDRWIAKKSVEVADLLIEALNNPEFKLEDKK